MSLFWHLRFASRFGYHKMLMPDEGSQIVKGCHDRIISFSDIENKISTEYKYILKPVLWGNIMSMGKW